MAATARDVLQSLPVKGALVGLCATGALDAISTVLYERESPVLRFKEDATRGWLHAYERGAAKMVRPLGIRLSRRQARTWGWRLHKAFGTMGGLQYVALRRRVPGVGKWGGLGFGVAFFAVADELLMPLLGFTPGPRKFSWKVHARGAIAHVIYGVAAELTARLIEAASSSRRPPAALPLSNGVVPSFHALERLGDAVPEEGARLA